MKALSDCSDFGSDKNENEVKINFQALDFRKSIKVIGWNEISLSYFYLH